LKQSDDKRSIARFLAADAFFPFWIQAVREPSAEELHSAESSATRAMQIANELGDAELKSVALDAIGAFSTAVSDWKRARETAEERTAFEDKLGLYERLDAHSAIAWMSWLIGDLDIADRDSAQMVARLLPGQAPYPALHLFAWRAVTLYTLGRWDEAAAIFWRAIEAWHDAGSHAAGYGLRGFMAGFDIGKARGDARLTGAAADPIESIVGRFPANSGHHSRLAYMRGDSAFTADDAVLNYGYPSELAERRFSLAADRHQEVPRDVLDAALARAMSIRVPLLEAQIRRARGVLLRDEAELTAAIAIWEPRGALPSLGRARAEHGLLTGNSSEVEDGLTTLTKLGDLDYVDRFRLSVT
jgi:tetratricopeptide (TPR) repeat protein